MKAECKIRIEFDSVREADAVLSALKQEEEFKKRSVSKVNVEGNALSVEIIADDMVALRATANSYLRYLQAINSISGGNENEI